MLDSGGGIKHFLLGASLSYHNGRDGIQFRNGRFEVALKIPAMDFEHMVQVGAQLARQQKTDKDNSEPHSKQSHEEMAALYLEKQFAVNVAGKDCQLEWVGAEDDQASKWIYFELVLPPDRAASGEMTLTNKVFCDRNSGQINTVVFHFQIRSGLPKDV